MQRVVAGATTFDNGVNHYGSSDDNFAVFGEANVNFTRQFRLILGARGVRDDLSYHTDRVSTATATNPGTGVQPSFQDSGSTERDGVSGRAGVQYDISRDVTTYFTYSHGYKGPAYNVFFNESLANTGVLSAETNNSYEVGLKSQLFNRRLQLDLAGFITDFDNFQANSTQIIAGALVTNLGNAGSVTSRGVEADVTAKPIAGLTLDLDGWKLHVEGDYRIPLTARFDLDLDTDYDWQSRTQYQLNETPDTVQSAYGIWNASIGLIDGVAGWSLRVLVKNIADQHYSSYLAHGNLAGLVRWVPRDDNRYVGFIAQKTF